MVLNISIIKAPATTQSMFITSAKAFVFLFLGTYNKRKTLYCNGCVKSLVCQINTYFCRLKKKIRTLNAVCLVLLRKRYDDGSIKILLIFMYHIKVLIFIRENNEKYVLYMKSLRTLMSGNKNGDYYDLKYL